MKKLLTEWRQFLDESRGDWLDRIEPIRKEQNIFLSKGTFKGMRHVTQEDAPAWKPDGLWYSCGGAWIDWLKYNFPSKRKEMNYLYDIEIDYSRVCKISTTEELREFEEQFSVINDDQPGWSHMKKQINWLNVQESGYHGFEINPLVSRRYWLEYWDIPSGCIWEPSAVKNVKLIATRRTKRTSQP